MERWERVTHHRLLERYGMTEVGTQSLFTISECVVL